MKKWKAPTAALATAALTLGLLTTGSVSAFAATVCNGEITSDVVGDLTVPADANCVLGGITVSGNVTVEAGGWLDATSVAITGGVTGTDVYGISLDGDSVGGDIVVGSTDGGFVYLNDLAVTGNVQLIGTDVEINDSQLGGNLDVTDAPYVDLYQSSVAGDATITGSAFGVSVGNSVVIGTLTVADSARDIALDGVTAGNVSLNGNGNGGVNDSLTVTGTNVLGALSLVGNDPQAALGAGNNAGSVTGDYTGTAPGAGTVGDGEQAVVVVVPERNPGEFIWTIDGTSNLVNLGVAVENGDHFQANGNLNNIRVTDTRLTGDAWAVNGQLSDFTSGGDTVAGSGKFLGWTPGLAENTVGAVAGPDVVSGFVSGDGLGVSRELGSAPAAHPQGSVVLGAYLDLKLPVAIGTGTYNATLTLTALS